MAVNLFKSEKDAICFLGLLANMYKHFDKQVPAPDKEPTHTKGLNIHALVVDNPTGIILGIKQNEIHAGNNPLLHAEQLTLKEAIKKKNKITKRNPNTTSVESYYRNLLFNDLNSYDALKTGATIYTTLEPCPFCTSALLVSRMKRIVYITPDIVFGNSFYSLWTTFYKKYDIHYEPMMIVPSGPFLEKAAKLLKQLQKEVSKTPGVPGTLYFDNLREYLKNVSAFFLKVNRKDLRTEGVENQINSKTLENLKARIY